MSFSIFNKRLNGIKWFLTQSSRVSGKDSPWFRTKISFSILCFLNIQTGQYKIKMRIEVWISSCSTLSLRFCKLRIFCLCLLLIQLELIFFILWTWTYTQLFLLFISVLLKVLCILYSILYLIDFYFILNLPFHELISLLYCSELLLPVF